MKNRRKLFFTIIGLLFCALQLHAFPVSVRLEPDTGIFFGRVNEYVYYTGPNCGKQTLSRLEWEISPQWYMGAKASVYLFDIFFIKAEGKLLGLHGRSGAMTDIDWENVSRSDKASDYYITKHSVHENFIKSYADSRFLIGLSFEAPFLVRFEPSVSLRLQKFSFDGRNGNGIYGLEDSSTKLFLKADQNGLKYDFHGNVISYQQNRLFLDAGIKLSTTIFPLLYISICADISFLSRITAEDTHHLRQDYFRDSFEAFGELNFGAEIFFVFGRRKTTRAGASVTCQYIPEMTGKQESMDKSSGEWTSDKRISSGTDSLIFGVTFLFSYQF